MTDLHYPIAASQPLWDASSDGLVLVDTVGLILATNEAFDQMFGFADTDLVGQAIEVVVPTDRQHHHVGVRRTFEQHPVSRPMASRRQLEGLRRDGTTFPIHVALGQLDTATGIHTFAAVSDLTERFRLESESAKARRQHAMALERDRIAHDLHDTVIQRLFALGLTLEGLSQQTDPSKVGERIFTAVDTIDDIIDDLRSAIYGLRNRPSSTARTRDRILAILDEMQPSLGFAPTLAISGDVDRLTDPTIVDHLLAVTREALSNTARHADATEVTVSVDYASSEIQLQVTDNGVGLKENARRSGLSNLADRAVALDGSFEVRRGSPAGTFLRWSVPTDIG